MSDTLQVWSISLDLDPERTAGLAATLSKNETARARAMRSTRHRDRFIVAHGAVRAILATHLGREPAELELSLASGGKPSLAFVAGDVDLRFNLSHSDGHALVAIAIGREVGVDIERIDERTEVLQISRRYFGPEELNALLALPPAGRTEEFFRFWTLKEAYIKALGAGLRIPLDSFAVSPSGQAPVRLLRSDRGDAEEWTLRTLAVGGGYAAAVAVEGPIDALEERAWTPQGAPEG